MTRRHKIASLLAVCSIAAGVASLGPSASAQPQPHGGDRDPHTLPLGEVQPGRPVPMGQPGQPGQPGMVPMPGQRPGGFQPGQGQGRPFPPGFGPPQGQGPRPFPRGPQPHAVEHEEAHVAHECPGHGPLDSPHAPNWWQGILTVRNEAAQFERDPEGHFHRTDSFLSRLLFRYENDRDECDPKNQPPPFLATVLNFALLAFVIFRFGKKPLADALVARKKAMMAEIDVSTDLRNKAQARLADYKDKLRKLDETLEEMKRDHVMQGEAERKHVIAEAEERSARMKRDVEMRLEQELKTAKARLLQEAVDRAVAAAEDLLAKKTTAADQDRSADEYLAGLSAAWKADATQAHSAGGAS